MELLAQTCKILYDKQWLDKMEEFNTQKRHPMIKFENLYNYFHKVTAFQINIKNKIQELVNDDSLFTELDSNIEWLNDDIEFVKKLRIFLRDEILKITNNTEKKWCGETAITTINSIKGGLKGLQLATTVTKNNVRDMCICIIFATFSTNDRYQPIFDKISFMECHICKKLSSNVIHTNKLICEKCITQETP